MTTRRRCRTGPATPDSSAGNWSSVGPISARALQRMIEEIEAPFAEIVRLYDDTPSLQDRTCNTGFVSRELVERWADIGARAAADDRGDRGAVRRDRAAL